MGNRQRRTHGAILKVPLDDQWHAYAWTFPEADFGFFNLRTATDVPIEEVIKCDIAFRVAVHKSAWTQGRWRRVGKAEPPPELLAPVPTFIQDPIGKQFQIYLYGDIRPATREECIGLERCAVWDPHHVEDRLRDHFNGVPNKYKWVQSSALPPP